MRLLFSGILIFGVITGFFHSKTAAAASCCGGGFATPALIVGDERGTLSVDVSYADIATEVSSSGFWQNRSSPESIETFRLHGAHIFLDRFQAGVSASFINRSRQNQSSAGLGDVALNVGYETLPEWDYSRWRPRGVSYMTLNLPLGRSIQDATEPFQLDARGRGFWSVALGTALTKVRGPIDIFVTVEARRSFVREVKTKDFTGQLRPGYGALASFGVGFNHQLTRLGGSVSLNYEDPIETRGSISSTGSVTRFVTAALSLSQMLNDEWTLSVSYSDQTLFGAPQNTSLARTLMVTTQHRIGR